MNLPPGYTAEPFRRDLIPEAVPFFNSLHEADTGESGPTTVELLQVQFDAPGINVEESASVIRTASGDIAAVVGVVGMPPYVQLYTLLQIHPDHEALLPLLAAELDRNGKLLAAQAPDGARVYLMGGVDGANQRMQRLYDEAGFQKARGFWEMRIDMEAPPPAPQWAAGFELRPFDIDRDLRAVYEALDAAFEDHFGHVEIEDDADVKETKFGRFKHQYTNPAYFDPALWFVLYDAASGDIAGFSLCIPEHPAKQGVGYVNAVGVLREYRRKGLAKALLLHSFGAFYERGITAVGLDVDADSLTGATRLYENVGMRVFKESFMIEKTLREGEDLTRR